jgi:tRNA uridine 5-carboxymethylaminomethyl modification enzyme
MGLSPPEAEQVEIGCKYAGYIQRMQTARERYRKAERVRIDPSLKFASLPGLKREAAEVLARFRPATLGQAGRLAGITPADIAVLEVHLRRDRVGRG